MSSLNFSLNFDDWMRLIDCHTTTDFDEALFKKGLQEHPEWVRQIDRNQQYPITKASLMGNVEAVKALMKAGADFKFKNQRGETILMLVADVGCSEVVKDLIESGVSVKDQDQYGYTALMHVADKGYTEVVKLLIQSGSDLNLQSQEGWTSLMYASNRGWLPIVMLLNQAGTDLYLQDQKGLTALDWAKKKGQDSVIRYLEAYMTHQAMNQDIQPLEYSSKLKGSRL